MAFQILARCCAASRCRRVVGAHGQCGRLDAVRRRVDVLEVDLRGGTVGGEGDVGGDGMGICARVSFDSCWLNGEKVSKCILLIDVRHFLLS